jgi:diphosphomevalonate decarboxylase
MKATAKARSNIALVKYWGKRDSSLNLPAVGSLSITLDALWTETAVELEAGLERDRLVLNGRSSDQELGRVSACLDLLRAKVGRSDRAVVTSYNNFPTAAGLASSASGFAALVAAANRALGAGLEARELSIIARRGSGSAARSIFGGFVEMHVGSRADGSDSYAEPLMSPDEWPLEVIIAITRRAPKDVSSGRGMTRSSQTSPYYRAWVETHPADLRDAHEAVLAKDFEKLAAVSESSCLKMHAAALASEPPLLYWNGVTVECIHAIRAMRAQGTSVFLTIDAGPQVKAVCDASAADEVAATLAEIPGVVDIMRSGLGAGVETS